MNISNSGLDFIKDYEGLRLKAYKVLDSEKHYTIGYGHYGSDVRFGQTITKAKADELFKKDVKRFENAVNRLVKVDINQNQFDALVSFAYNVGEGALQDSTLLSKLNRGDFKGASAEFPRWNKSGGKVLAGLTKRRAKERALFDKATAKSTGTKSQAKSGASSYTVKSGDTLSEIAQDNGTTTKKLLELNPSIKNANEINVGQKIQLKGSTSKTHKVKSGDTLSEIAQDNNTTVAKLKSLNNIKDANKIQIGETIKLN